MHLLYCVVLGPFQTAYFSCAELKWKLKYDLSTAELDTIKFGAWEVRLLKRALDLIQMAL